MGINSLSRTNNTCNPFVIRQRTPSHHILMTSTSHKISCLPYKISNTIHGSNFCDIVGADNILKLAANPAKLQIQMRKGFQGQQLSNTKGKEPKGSGCRGGCRRHDVFVAVKRLPYADATEVWRACNSALWTTGIFSSIHLQKEERSEAKTCSTDRCGDGARILWRRDVHGTRDATVSNLVQSA